jgi:hypothetical protein
MKIHDLPPIFLANMQHRFHWSYLTDYKVKIVKLLYLPIEENFLSTILCTGEIYYGYEDTASSNRFTFQNEYKVYKIFHPILGARKYKPSRFKVLDTLILKKSDFYEISDIAKKTRDLSFKDSKNKNKEQYSGPSKEVHTGALFSSGSVGFPNTHR